MTDEFKWLRKLFAEDSEPGARAWSKLADRVGPLADLPNVPPRASAIGSGPSGSGPELWLTESETGPPPRHLRKRLVLTGVALSVVAAFGFVASGAFARRDAVHSAFASLFGSPTLQVAFSLSSSGAQILCSPPSGGSCSPAVTQYSIVLTVSSENGSQPLSGSDGVDDFEISVYHGDSDIGDLLVAGGAVYGRLNLEAISPSDYARATRSVNAQVPAGVARPFADAFLNDQWIGVDDSTLATFAKSVGVTSSGPSFETVRNAAALSFAQSWDELASIRQGPTVDGTTQYSLDMPARSFAATFVQHLDAVLGKELPSLKESFNLYSGIAQQIPQDLSIPVNMWVAGGVLNRLDATFKQFTLDLAISHPAAAVSPPAGALMLTTPTIAALESDYNICPPLTNGGGVPGCQPLFLGGISPYLPGACTGGWTGSEIGLGIGSAGVVGASPPTTVTSGTDPPGWVKSTTTTTSGVSDNTGTISTLPAVTDTTLPASAGGTGGLTAGTGGVIGCDVSVGVTHRTAVATTTIVSPAQSKVSTSTAG